LLVSPRDLKEFFFPWLREVGRIAEKNSLPMIYHSDGDLTSVMEDLIDCGVDAIHPIEPKAMNIVEVKERWGDRLALIGNIDLGYTLTLGTVDEVVREVKERIRDLAPGGGYAVGTSNTVTDYVKLENYKAMIAATKKWGRYPIRLR
ncbi:nucleoside 2-deoxyribosyltransferase, partial [Candidatus Bathyarchaeota archaeon]